MFIKWIFKYSLNNLFKLFHFNKQEWLDNGQHHQEDGPTVILDDGTQEWWLNGKYHRIGGPAIIDNNGDKVWCINGFVHNENGPAIIWADGTQHWRINNQLHRVDGPAVIYSDGEYEWWANGRNVTQEVDAWMQQQNVKWPWDEETQAQFVLTFF